MTIGWRWFGLWTIFFYGLFRGLDQTLLSYCSDHREALREVEKHGIKIPPEVEGWILLRRAGLSAEQMQLIQSQLQNKFTASLVEEAKYYLLGHDYKTAARGQSRTWVRAGAKPAKISVGWRRYGTANA